MKNLKIKEPKVGNVTWEYDIKDSVHTKRFISFMYFLFLFLVNSLISLLFLLIVFPNFDLISNLYQENNIVSFIKPLLVGSLFATTTYVVISISMSKELQQILKHNLNLKALKQAIIISCIWFLGTILLSYIISTFSSSGGSNANQDTLESSIKLSPFVMFLSVVIMGPLMEEIAFRYGIIGSFKNKWIGLVVSFVTFGSLHMLSSIGNGTLSEDIVTLPIYLWMGFMTGLIYIKTDNILYSLALHVTNNLIAFMSIIL